MYDLVLTIHIASMVFTLTLVVLSDLAGLMWVLGITQTVREKWLRLSHRLIYVGLSFSIVSGAYLFSAVADYLLTLPVFYVKMGFIAALLINAMFIGRHISLAARTPFSNTHTAERIKLFASTIVSIVGWIGVLICANLLGL